MLENFDGLHGLHYGAVSHTAGMRADRLCATTMLVKGRPQGSATNYPRDFDGHG
jgi:hypothetical protein